MSTIYSGDGTIPTSSYARKAIVSSTWTAPIVLTVTAHGLTTGDFVEVAGHTLNTTANGRWIVTVIDANTFTLVGSLLGGSAGGADGYVISYAVHPLITIPSDGIDARNVASVNVPAEAAQDKIAYLYERSGRYRLYNAHRVEVSDDGWAAWSTNVGGVFGAAAWGAINSGAMGLDTAAPAPIAKENDILEAFATMTVTTTNASNNISAVGLGIALDVAGAFSVIAGSGQRLPSVNATFLSLSLHGYYLVPAGTAAQHKFDVAVLGFGNIVLPATVNFVGHRQFTINHYRPN